MEINKPDVLAEVTQAFWRYEQALDRNDVAVLNELSGQSPYLLRYGITENLYGYPMIAAFRSSRPTSGLTRQLKNL